MTSRKLSLNLLNEKEFKSKVDIKTPEKKIFSLPEKVLQFGTGVLLRGLPDYFIDKANRNGVFNGRIVVVKSTESAGADSFTSQDGLFVHNIRGIEKGKNVKNYIINSSISRVLSAKSQWKDILACAHNPELKIILSNTTEVGIVLTEDNINNTPPSSFPGKLTAFLYERFKAFNGSKGSGMVIVPTELIIDNGIKLKEIVFKLAEKNKLEDAFIDWLKNNNSFCNSLVDRIVPGSPNDQMKQEIFEHVGFQDDLLIMSEPYRLWAIEGDKKIKEILSFSKEDKGVIIEPDITPYRERKLRLLNGTHTISVALGYLSGFNTVSECMNDSTMQEFISNIMHHEIVPSLDVDREGAITFADEVLERFKNPAIVHQLISITLQYTSKMNMRNARTIINFYKKYNEIPKHFALGFAAYLLFMKTEKQEGDKFYGKRKDEYYLINDSSASFFFTKWEKADVNTPNSCKLFVEEILNNESIWDKELKAVAGFSDLVAHALFDLMHVGVRETLDEFVELGEIDE